MQWRYILSNITYNYHPSWSLSEIFCISFKPVLSGNSQHQFFEVGSGGLLNTESTEKLTLLTSTRFVCFVLLVFIFVLSGCSIKFLLKRQILVLSFGI